MPEGMQPTTLRAENAWKRLDHFLVDQLDGLSRTRIQTLIKRGLVRVDDVTVLKAREPLEGGENIQVDVPSEPDLLQVTPEDLPLDIIHEDESIMVLNKPAGMVVHPGHGVSRGTLVNGLVGRFDKLSTGSHQLRPGIVHRLDKGTSGVLVVACHDQAHRSLAAQFERREVDKTYLALVWGLPEPNGRIELNLRRDPRNRLAFTTSSTEGRPAVTEYRVSEAYPGFSLLEVQPRTGRTHQIRVHLSYKGHPIFGDDLYRGVRNPVGIAPESRGLAREMGRVLQRPALHAHRLGFTHPGTGKHVEFEIPPPTDFAAALSLLRQHNNG
ncbi:MAG: RluA family pseudouridine synthase [Candidatus Neomarinimicrobiota bacterium]